ncbi:hypothetical protein [Microbacterium kyungheense]|uniref:Uncharacterized protein YdhG (YjbR/CyaY superfamily) n=1 Tax=Microbacterium kyungheense TaxID=1263636 RepID=A0A543EF94_9MICO|nr:hypothetical protein [Microbacterium kyungheense]TQM20233.1 uncharacterized protein YdhG (YjbR/CyaY superfamily) [Microbacterium kyungheense]
MAEKASETLSEIEREAVKQRAKELREQAKAGKNREAGLKQIQEAIDKLDGLDKQIAEEFREIVLDVAPELMPRTFYGFVAFANADGKVVVFYQPASKFKTRYGTISFDDPAHLDDGDVWPVSYAVLAWNADIEAKFRDLVKTAAS